MTDSFRSPLSLSPQLLIAKTNTENHERVVGREEATGRNVLGKEGGGEMGPR